MVLQAYWHKLMQAKGESEVWVKRIASVYVPLPTGFSLKDLGNFGSDSCFLHGIRPAIPRSTTTHIQKNGWHKFHVDIPSENQDIIYIHPSDQMCITVSSQWEVTGCIWTTYPWPSRLQPECQDVEEGGGRIRSWSSCIWSLIGRRRPQKIFSKPSKISSPSSYWKTGAVITAHAHINTHNAHLLGYGV